METAERRGDRVSPTGGFALSSCDFREEAGSGEFPREKRVVKERRVTKTEEATNQSPPSPSSSPSDRRSSLSSRSSFSSLQSSHLTAFSSSGSPLSPSLSPSSLSPSLSPSPLSPPLSPSSLSSPLSSPPVASPTDSESYERQNAASTLDEERDKDRETNNKQAEAQGEEGERDKGKQRGQKEDRQEEEEEEEKEEEERGSSDSSGVRLSSDLSRSSGVVDSNAPRLPGCVLLHEGGSEEDFSAKRLEEEAQDRKQERRQSERVEWTAELSHDSTRSRSLSWIVRPPMHFPSETREPVSRFPLITYRGTDSATQKLIEEKLAALSRAPSSYHHLPSSSSLSSSFSSSLSSFSSSLSSSSSSSLSSSSSSSLSASSQAEAPGLAVGIGREQERLLNAKFAREGEASSWSLLPFGDLASYVFRSLVAGDRPEGPSQTTVESPSEALSPEEALEEANAGETVPAEATSSSDSGLFSSSSEDDLPVVSSLSSQRRLRSLRSFRDLSTKEGASAVRRHASERARVCSSRRSSSVSDEGFSQSLDLPEGFERRAKVETDSVGDRGAAGRSPDPRTAPQTGVQTITASPPEARKDASADARDFAWNAEGEAFDSRELRNNGDPSSFSTKKGSLSHPHRVPSSLASSSQMSCGGARFSSVSSYRLPPADGREAPPTAAHPSRLSRLNSARESESVAENWRFRKSQTMLLASKWRRRAHAAAVAAEKARVASASVPSEKNDESGRKKKPGKAEEKARGKETLSAEELALRNCAIVSRVAAAEAVKAAEEAAEKSVRAALVEAALKFRVSRVTLQDWMKSPGIQQKRIWDIIFPATHNSASWKVEETTMKQPMLLSMIKNWVTCQHVNITEQLSRGIRWLDLRVCKLGDASFDQDSSQASRKKGDKDCSEGGANPATQASSAGGWKVPADKRKQWESSERRSAPCDGDTAGLERGKEERKKATNDRGKQMNEQEKKRAALLLGLGSLRAIPYCAHGGVCTVPLLPVLCEIREFLDSHPSEIIILSLVADHGVCQGTFCDTRPLHAGEVDFYLGKILGDFLGPRLGKDTTLEQLLKRNQRVIYFWSHEERCLPPFDLCLFCRSSFSPALPTASASPSQSRFASRCVEATGLLVQARREKEQEGRSDGGACTCERGRLQAWLRKAHMLFSTEPLPGEAPDDRQAALRSVCRTLRAGGNSQASQHHGSHSASPQPSPRTTHVAPQTGLHVPASLAVPASPSRPETLFLSPEKSPTSEFLSPSLTLSPDERGLSRASSRPRVSPSALSYSRSPFHAGKTVLLKSWRDTRAAKPEILITHLDAWLQERKQEATKEREYERRGNKPYVFKMLCGEVTAPDSLGLHVVLYWTKEAQSALRSLPHGIKTSAKTTNRLLLRFLAEQNVVTRELRDARLHHLEKALRRAKRRRERDRHETREGATPESNDYDLSEAEEKQAILRQLEDRDGLGEVKGLHVLNGISHDFVNRHLTEFIVQLNLEKLHSSPCSVAASPTAAASSSQVSCASQSLFASPFRPV
ncbi:hypothetical protein TGRUB_315080 [Toxoplasma gondii RUB]|uniref:Phosphatidylinositol-specific phospholipase C X domain-containing protein n=1 Tax=Toxoplasma gondii RUB TaxID=935652 RepID=A0A086MBM7_TOXGO|nr:hypothetical protein TGRUB_315080 [Toxoplasma gondii RUB]